MTVKVVSASERVQPNTRRQGEDSQYSSCDDTSSSSSPADWQHINTSLVADLNLCILSTLDRTVFFFWGGGAL